MKKILFILSLFVSLVSFGQSDTLIGKGGKKLIDTASLFSNYKSKIQTNIDSINDFKNKTILGKIYNLNPVAASSSLYTATAPQTTFTFTSSGITASGGNNDALNYLEYNSYATCASYWTRRIKVIATSDGNGIGLGINSSGGKIIARMIMTGGNKGKLLIDTYRSGTLTNRVTSTAALTYTNTSDTVEFTFTRSMMNYKVTAKRSSDTTFLTTEWTDPLTYGSISSVYNTGYPSIYHFGGSQTVVNDFYSVNMKVQNEVLLYGNSILAGAFCGGADSMVANTLQSYIPDGVNLIAGGGNQSSSYILGKPEIMALKPKVAVWTDGINDIINSVSVATTEANITTFIRDCYANGIIPVVCTVYPVASAYASSSTINANILTLNTWINALTNCTVIDIYTAISSATFINSLYDAGDGLHLNSYGNRAFASSLITGLKNFVNIKPTILSSMAANNFISTINGNGSVIWQFSNPNVGTSANAGIRVVAGTTTGYLANYPSTYAATAQYQGKTLFGNTGSGVIIAALSSSTGIEFHTNNSTTPKGTVNSSGLWRLGDATTGAGAWLTLAAGTTTVAPLKFVSGTNLTSAAAGNMEYDGTELYFSPSTTRKKVDLALTGSATLDFASTGSAAVADLTITVTGAAVGDVVELGVPNGSVTATATFTAWVSATNTVTVRFSPKATEDPASGTFKVRVIQ